MFDSTRYVGALGLVLALGACGGGAFAPADEGSGASGSGGDGGSGSGKVPPQALGGGSAIDDPPVSGGSGMVDPGGVPIIPGVIGGSSSQAGSGGSGVIEPEPDPGPDPVDPGKLDLTECGPDAFGTGIMPTLYSTLDSEEAITLPAIGELGFVGNAEGDYHGDRCGGTSINIDQNGDYIKYHYQDNDVRHFSPFVGAMDFWYRPNYAHTDGLNHHLFASANWQTSGGFRVRKAASDNANSFQVIVGSSELQVMEIAVPADQYSFSPGQWARVTIVWYLDADFPERYVRLYLDGELAGEAIPENDFQMAPDEGGYFVFGAWDFGDPGHANGLLDELKIFGRGP